jgi:VWFA-related protein
VLSRDVIVRPLALLVACATISAQNPVSSEPQEPPPDTIIRINVNLVQIDAVVTDSQGKPVTDLKADDFQILQDNKGQHISNFAYISTRAAADTSTPVRAPAPVKGKVVAPPPPPSTLKPSQVRRTIALVVDDLGLSFDSVARVRSSLKKFVDQQMQPGDLVAIIRSGAGIGALQQFTTDKRVLYAAIDRVKFNSFGRVGVSSFAPLGSDNGTGSAEADERRYEIFSVGTLGAVGYVVQGLRELPGRKSVILFSENLKLFTRGGLNQEIMDNMRHLIDRANRASVVIYSIDPRGLQTTSLTAADDTSRMNPRQIARVPMQRAAEEINSREGMVMLAHDTGGLFMYNTNDIDGALRKVVEDGGGYYLIGYHPDASTFDPKTGEFRYHNIKVKVKRPGLTVRTRQGFYGQSDRQNRPSVPQTRQGELLHALSSPFGASDIHVRLTPFFTTSPQFGSFVSGILYIEPQGLTFTDEPEGLHKATLDVLAVTFGDNGQPIDSSDRTFTLTMKEGGYQDTLKNGLFYNFRQPVKKPGAYQVRIALRDSATGKVGSASQFIEVPDVSKGHLTLSTLVMKSLPPEAPTEAAKSANPGAGEEGQVHETDAQGSPGVRIFKPGTAILYGYQVLNAQPGPDKQAALEAQTRLFRDGKEFYVGKPMELSSAQQPDVKHLVEGGSLKLGPGLAPGDYVLQVVVSDKLAKDKYNTASQWIDFEVK